MFWNKLLFGMMLRERWRGVMGRLLRSYDNYISLNVKYTNMKKECPACGRLVTKDAVHCDLCGTVYLYDQPKCSVGSKTSFVLTKGLINLIQSRLKNEPSTKEEIGYYTNAIRGLTIYDEHPSIPNVHSDDRDYFKKKL